jgi:ribosomal protein S24E
MSTNNTNTSNSTSNNIYPDNPFDTDFLAAFTKKQIKIQDNIQTFLNNNSIKLNRTGLSCRAHQERKEIWMSENQIEQISKETNVNKELVYNYALAHEIGHIMKQTSDEVIAWSFAEQFFNLSEDYYVVRNNALTSHNIFI